MRANDPRDMPTHDGSSERVSRAHQCLTMQPGNLQIDAGCAELRRRVRIDRDRFEIATGPGRDREHRGELSRVGRLAFIVERRDDAHTGECGFAASVTSALETTTPLP